MKLLMMKLLTAVITVFLIMSVAKATEFEVGQKWSYKTRPVEPESTFTVVKIDDFKKVKVIHISLHDVKIKNPESPSGFREYVSHLPLSEEALKNSVVKIVDTVKALPDYEKDYKAWLAMFGQAEGGYFTGPLAQCVEYLEQALNK